jgi:hypothetical protein
MQMYERSSSGAQNRKREKNMKNEINLIEGIIEDWHNLADYDGKEKDGESLDTAWAKIKEIIKKYER